MAKRTYANGRSLEERFYNYLTSEFYEISIHEHKVIRPGNVNCDFYIYLNQDVGLIIDIFYAENIINLINVVNIKLKRYALVKPETYLVIVGNDQITQRDINSKIENRRIPIPSHINLVSEQYFKERVIPELKLRSDFTK